MQRNAVRLTCASSDGKNRMALARRWASQFAVIRQAAKSVAGLAKLLTVLVTLMLGVSPPAAAGETINAAKGAGFKLGPLALGMTNAEVVKLLPLKRCSARGAAMECTAELTALGEVRSVDLTFDTATKKLRKIDLRTSYMNRYDRDRPEWNDKRLPQFLAELGIEPCPADTEEKKATYSVAIRCFNSSTQMREIGLRHYAAINYREQRPDYYILIESAPAAYRAFMKAKAETAAMKKRSATNEVRERRFLQGK